MSKASFSAIRIMEQLDKLARKVGVPWLDNGYIYPGDVRLSAYADATRWAIIIEQLGFFYKLLVPDGIHTTLYVYGNCSTRPAGYSDRVGGLTFDEPPNEEDRLSIPPSLTEVVIRGRRVPIPRDPAVYAAKGIILSRPPSIRGDELMRVLLPEHREGMLATEEERRRLIPHDLPLFAQLNEWYHPNLSDDELITHCLTFYNLADAMVAMEPNMFRLTEKPNTHWSNWPMGGSL